jgi:hypothetical protein
MDMETFDTQTKLAMSTHRTKVEVLAVLRALAQKYSELGDHDKGLSYTTRAEGLSAGLLQSQEHEQILLLTLTKVEILLKKYRFGTPEELQEPIKIAKQAFALAKKIYGEKALVTNQTMLNYAMALTKNPDTREEGL